MKKIFSIVVALICVLALAGCVQAGGSGEPVAGGADMPKVDGYVKDNEKETTQSAVQLAIETEKWDSIPMVMINGELYLDTNELSDFEGRCGVMDGEITSEVLGNEKPTKDDESNFGIGFGYQFVGEGMVDIFIEEEWYRFENGNTPLEEPALADPISLNLIEYSSKGATFTIGNQTDEIYTYGEEYTLKVLKEYTWEAVPYIIEDWGFNSIGYELIGQSESDKITIDWIWLYGEIPDGTYKITKGASSQGNDYTISNEFELVNGEEVKILSYTLVKSDEEGTIISQKEITDELSMKLVNQTVFDVLVKSSRLDIDTSTVDEFYKVVTNYTNGEDSEMTFYEVDGIAYGDGTVCTNEIYQIMIELIN